MPRKPITWENCIIYKIWKDDDFYIGSTTDFTNRKRQHKQSCNNEKDKGYNYKIYKIIREKGGWLAWEMTPLEEYKDCKSLIEARIREEEWRVKIQANLNMQKCYADSLTKEYHVQYREENKEQITEKKKYIYQKNKEENVKKAKIYREEHKEQIAEKDKIRSQKNKEQIAKRAKEWREANKKIIAEKKKEKYECVCGDIICKSHKARHERSQKHILGVSKK